MKYIVLVAVNVGGAEKRFFDIFRGLVAQQRDVKLVLSSQLYEKFIDKITEDISSRLIVIGDQTDGLLSFCLKYAAWFFKYADKTATFHYPTNCMFFLHFFSGMSRVSVSLTNCYHPPRLLSFSRSRVRQYITLIFVSKIDVLSPNIYEKIKKYRLLKYKSVTLTPSGTYVFPLPAGIRKGRRSPAVGCVSRLIEGKGVEEFLNSIPALWERIKGRVPDSFIFYVAGFGPMEQEIKSKVDELKECGFPVTFFGYVKSEEFFKSASLVLSAQSVTNYPSRVVAEARLSGCTVLVRDTGDSRHFGPAAAGLDYFPSDFNADILGDLIVKYSSLYEKDSNFPLAVAQQAQLEYSSSAVLDYFDSLLVAK